MISAMYAAILHLQIPVRLCLILYGVIEEYVLVLFSLVFILVIYKGLR